MSNLINLQSFTTRRKILYGAAVLALLVLVGLVSVNVATGQTCTGTCALIALDTPDKTADFYVNGVMVAQGVNSTTLSVAPFVYTRVDIRNIQDPSPEFTVVYVWNDTFANMYGYNNVTSSWLVAPSKIWIQGYVRLVCSIQNATAADDVACRPTLNGVLQADMLPGAGVSWNLPPGQHSLHVDLVGTSAGAWVPQALDYTPSVTPGITTTVSTAFQKQGSMTIVMNVPNGLADYYVDGQLVGQQVASVKVLVSAYSLHTVSATNISDPAANGVYVWKDAKIVASVLPGQDRTLTLHPQKQYIMGFALIRCVVPNWTESDGGTCNVSIDGVLSGTFTPNTSIKVAATTGSRQFLVGITGTVESKWRAPDPKYLTIYAGQTVYSNFTFAIQTGPPLPEPALPYNASLTGFGANARNIFLRGQAIGRDAHRFTKVGDSDSDNIYFATPFDAKNYALNEYIYLEPIIGVFSGSFQHIGQSAHIGFVAASVLDPLWASPDLCNDGESPLACEYRVYNPAFSIIMVRTYPVPWGDAERAKYQSEMRAIISYTINQRIVPIVSSVPMIYQSPGELNEMNAINRALASEYDVPYWDLYSSVFHLEKYGVDGVNHLTVPPDGGSSYFDAEHLKYGMTHRNLELLEVLYELYLHVMN